MLIQIQRAYTSGDVEKRIPDQHWSLHMMHTQCIDNTETDVQNYLHNKEEEE